MNFRIGQKVVCIGGPGSPRPLGYWKAWAREWGITLPKRSEVYTVRDIRIAADGTQRVRLLEIVNPAIGFTDAPDQEPWFWSTHFRPVVDRKTDISIFTKMLKREVVRV